MAEEEESQNNFIKQRRNLIGISLLLLFYLVSGIVIEKINLLGNEVKVTNALNISAILWIIWGYFLLRYYQYFRDALRTHPIKAAIKEKGDYYLPTMIFKKVKKEVKKRNIEFIDPDVKLKHPYKLYLLDSRRKHDGFGSKQLDTIYLNLVVQGADGGSITKQVERKVTKKERLYSDIKAFIYNSFHTFLFTEYFLPFLIAASPLGYKIYKWPT